MKSRKSKRKMIVFLAIVMLAISTILVGYGMREGIQYFKTPTEVLANPDLSSRKFRIGGLVKAGSIKSLSNGEIIFEVTDLENSIAVHFTGITPDLFAENQGVIAIGVLKDNGDFYATEILAKHDENYKPVKVQNK